MISCIEIKNKIYANDERKGKRDITGRNILWLI